MGDGQHGATHAWTEVYIPGAGWHGFDPTDDKLAGSEQISVAVAREQENASPFSSAWSGPANAFNRMEVSVEVYRLKHRDKAHANWQHRRMFGLARNRGSCASAGESEAPERT